MVVQRCLLVRNTRQTESLVIHFPFLFLLGLGSHLVGVHPETWPDPRWPLHISVQNYFRFVLIELNTLWFALNSCHSMSTRSIKMSCNCSCFSSKYYRTPLWGLRKRVTGSSEFVTGTNHHILSQCFVQVGCPFTVGCPRASGHGGQRWKLTSLHLLDRCNIPITWM